VSVRRTSRAIRDEDRASIEALHTQQSRYIRVKDDFAHHGCFLFLLPVVGALVLGVLLTLVGVDAGYGYLIGLAISFSASMLMYRSSLRSLRETRERFDATYAAMRAAKDVQVIELDVLRAWRVWPNDDLTPLLCEVEDGTFALVFDKVMPEEDETAARELVVVLVPPGAKEVLRTEWRGRALDGVIGAVLAEEPDDHLVWSSEEPVRILARTELPASWLSQLDLPHDA
jgi:hypothetical protein